MVNIFVVRHHQPADIPFQVSPSSKQIHTKKYMNTCKVTIMVILICMATFYNGLCLSMISAFNTEILTNYFGSFAGQKSTVGFLIGLFTIGAAIGSLLSGIFLKYFTRRQILIIFDVVAIITTGLLQIPNIGLLLAMRVMQGIITGVFMAVVGLYVKQIVPMDLQGSQGVIIQALVIFGGVVDFIIKVAFIAYGANQEFFWRFAFGITGLPVIIQLIFLGVGYVPQSPMSLIQRDRIDEAKVVLAEFNIPEVLNDVVAEMVHQSKKSQLKQIAKNYGITPQISRKQIEAAHNRKIDPANSSKQFIKEQQIVGNGPLKQILQVYARQKSLEPQIKNILSHHHIQAEPVPYVQPQTPKKGIILGFVLHAMQQLSGIKMCITSCGIIFNGLNQTLALYTPLVANSFQFVATCLAALVLSRYGRKNPTIVGDAVLAVANFIIGGLFLANLITSNVVCLYVAAAFIVIFMIAFGLTLGPIVWPFVPQLMPAKYIPYAACMNWISAAFCIIATPYIQAAVGSPYPVFFMFGAIMIIFFIINWNLLIETKGLTPTQIAAQLAK